MENKDAELHEGFIGEAMRKAEAGSDSPSNMEINHSDLGKIPADKVILDANPPGIEEIKNKILKETIMEEPNVKQTTQSKVISGKNGEELELNINKFLSANGGIEIIKTEFGTTQGGIYYVILFNTMTRV